MNESDRLARLRSQGFVRLPKPGETDAEKAFGWASEHKHVGKQEGVPASSDAQTVRPAATEKSSNTPA